MKEIFFFSLLFMLFVSCQNTDNKSVESKCMLCEELDSMVILDQKAAGIPCGKFTGRSIDDVEWLRYRDSIFASNNTRVKSIIERVGYPGYDLVGEEGEKNFWLIVQHADSEPGLQKAVLSKMKEAVLNQNASSKNYAFLLDRILINENDLQIYGTQLDYDTELCLAIPKKIKDSSEIDSRRMELGLEPLHDYLNTATKIHFEMNREYYAEKGIVEPGLYKVPETLLNE